MLAAYYDKFGGTEVLNVGYLPDPIPGENEALIAVRASALNPVDYRLRSGEAKFLMKKKFPRIPGNDFAGEVVTSKIEGLRNGQQVFGYVHALPPGGSNAKFLVAKPENLAPKPKNLLFEEAAALPLAGLTAIQALRNKASLQREQTVLINGCCGGVGSMAVQFAQHLGATVRGVCSTQKVELAKELGCENVFDYKKEDITGKYHVIFDTVGNLKFRKMKNQLEKGGTMVNINPYPSNFFTMFWSRFTSTQFKVFLTKANAADFDYLRQLAEDEVIKPVIDKQFNLEQIKDAYAYLEKGHAAGKVVVI